MHARWFDRQECFAQSNAGGATQSHTTQPRIATAYLVGFKQRELARRAAEQPELFAEVDEAAKVTANNQTRLLIQSESLRPVHCVSKWRHLPAEASKSRGTVQRSAPKSAGLPSGRTAAAA